MTRSFRTRSQSASTRRKGAAHAGHAAHEYPSDLSQSSKPPHQGANVKFRIDSAARVPRRSDAARGRSAAALSAAPAGASSTQMTAVGSFTTFFMMHALFPQSLNDINPNPLSGSNTQAIASDNGTCSGGLIYSTATQPPNGSGAGKTVLAAEGGCPRPNEQGCIDFSRSSSPPGPHALTLPSGTTS